MATVTTVPSLEQLKTSLEEVKNYIDMSINENIKNTPNDIVIKDNKIQLVINDKVIGKGIDSSGIVKQYSSYYDISTLINKKKTVTYKNKQEIGPVGSFSFTARTGYVSAIISISIIFGVQPDDSSYPKDFIPFFSNSPDNNSINREVYLGLFYEDQYQWFPIHDILTNTFIEAFGEDSVEIKESFFDINNDEWKSGFNAGEYFYSIDIDSKNNTELIEVLRETVSTFNSMIENNMIKLRFDWQNVINPEVKEAILL